MKKIFTLSLFFVLAITSHAQIRYLKGLLQAGQEVPPTASTGAGVVIVKYNMATKELQLIGNYAGLSGPINNSHIHRGEPGVSGPVIIPLANTGGTTGTISGTATITQAWEDSLLAGNTYANVHSTVYGAGELRAQLTLTSDGQTDFFTGRMEGAQQVPPNASVGTGKVTALLDRVTRQVFLTGDFHNLTTAASASHIHRGAAATSGPVSVPLSATADTSGTAWGSATVSSTFADSMSAGNTYFNIHNSTYPGGEIRAQLIKAYQIRFFKATLTGGQQVPANASPGKGTVIIKYMTDTRILELIGDYQNVTAPITASHIHSPAAAGSNAGVLFPLKNTGGTSGVISGTDTLTVSQDSALFAGLMYVNVHNTTYPGGEIRGQLSATTAGETQYFTNILAGSQQVPVNASTATGKVAVLLDKATNQVFLTGEFHNLVAKASAAHIHRGLAGTNGPVIVPLSATADTSGTITGSATVSPTFADSMVRGFTYVNIHDSINPGGEIRTQLGDLVLPVQLTYFNGFKNNSQVVLTWEAAQEVNVKNYEVEQQNTETGEWVKKTTVIAKGGGSATKYRVSDVPFTDKKDFVMYRLKINDADGKVTYSSVVKINFTESKVALTIMPNPVVNGRLVLAITGLANEQKAEISVIDIGGRTMYKGVVSTLSTNSIDVSALSRGMYKLVVKTNDEILQQTFSKQ